VNTHTEYRRHSYRPDEQPTLAAPTEVVANELAHHRDPSLGTAGTSSLRSSKGVAWVRPTELGTYAGPLIGRGIDLQAELIRRARRTPATTARALQSHGPEIGAPPRPSTRQEGLQL
jgi:hypothetical protein